MWHTDFYSKGVCVCKKQSNGFLDKEELDRVVVSLALRGIWVDEITFKLTQ